MKKLLFALLLFTGVVSAQNQAIDSTKYDYIGYAIDSTLYAGDATYINKILDVDAILDKALVKVDDSKIQQYNKDFAEGFKSSFDFGAAILRELGEDGNYDFVKSYVKNGNEYHLIFRLYAEDGLNYHDYKLSENGGEVKISDMYLYLSGENFSKTLSDIYKRAIQSVSSDGVFKKLFKKTYIDDLGNLKKIKDLMRVGKYKEAYDVYKNVNSESRKEKIFMISALQVASNLDDSVYEEVIKQYEELFPNDPSLYLISIDGAVIKEDFEKAYELVNKLDRSLGGDDFLDLYRANVLYAKNDFEGATKYARKLVDNYPGFIEAHTTLLTILIERNQINEAIKALENFYDIFELTKEDMREAMEGDFPNFVKTKEYIAWMKKK